MIVVHAAFLNNRNNFYYPKYERLYLVFSRLPPWGWWRSAIRS